MTMQQHRQGDFIQADFFDNAGGLNLTDSPMRVLDEQATGGYNYEYSVLGGFRKRNGHTKLNSSADAQTQHLASGVFIDSSETVTTLRAAGRKIQSVVPTTGITANLTEDTVSAGSDFTPAAQTRPGIFHQFDTPSAKTCWLAGSNATSLYGVYSATKVTANGSTAPAGSISTSVGAGTSAFAATGTYYYAVVLRKASTQALSNATLDKSATIAATTDAVTITLSSITGVDTTKYDKIYIYRSSTGGVSGFTTGQLIAQVNTGTASYVDTGTYILDAQNIPRANSTILDNGTLPANGPFNVITTFKRRLVTAIGSTLYLSDINKPESWPGTNVFPIPSAGFITALAVIPFTTPSASQVDEMLVIFKASEVWVITGTNYTDWAIKKIDDCGTLGQPLVVTANGYLYFIDYRGVYVWDGAGKPLYASRLIEYMFSADGSLDKSKLNLGWGTFHKKSNQVIWYLSDSIIGEQKYSLKLDLRRTLPQIQDLAGERMIDGCFIQDKTAFPIYGGRSIYPSFDEMLLGGDASGYMYKLFDSSADASGSIAFSYETKGLDFGAVSQVKRVNKVIVWCEDSSDATLTLDFWTGYNWAEALKQTRGQPMSRSVSRSLWDVAYWDAADWDSSLRTYSPVVFNIPDAEGEAFRMRFSQTDADAPANIAGFSIIYSLGGMRR